MSRMNFSLPDSEVGIICRYLDGVSQAIARRFVSGSSPGEENLTFLLCELLDEGTTSLHLLDYPLGKAKADLAKADGGVTLDVSFQTHEHSKYVEHHFSGADLGVVFVVDHPHFGRSQRGVLLQAKRLFPIGSGGYALNSSFTSFHPKQRDVLKEIEKRFAAPNSAFYLWYAPGSVDFLDDDAKIIRSLEAMNTGDWRDFVSHHPFFEEMLEFGASWSERRWEASRPMPADDDQLRAWRAAQPAVRVSSLSVVDELTADGHVPNLISLYNARTNQKRRGRFWRSLAFEPLATLFLHALRADYVGNSSTDWLRLVRGEKVPMPAAKEANNDSPHILAMPDLAPTPRHTLTLTLQSTLRWPQDLPRPD